MTSTKSARSRWNGIIALLSLCLGLLAFGSSASASQTSSEAYLEDARGYLDGGEVDAAVIQLKNAISEDPKNFEARLLLADILLRTGRARASEQEVRAALKRGVARERVLLLLGQSYALQERYEDILREIKIDDVADEQRDEILLIRADAEIALGRLEEAAQSLKAFENLWPDDERGLLGSARLLIARGELSEAEAQVDAALLRKPDILEGLVLKGDLLRARGAMEDSLPYYLKATALRPGSVLPLERQAVARLALGQLEEAQQDIRAIEKITPDHPLIPYTKATELAKGGDFAGAFDTLQSASDSLKGFPPAVYLLGVAAFAQGDLAEAERSLNAYLETDPRHTPSRKLLAAAHLRSNLPEKAVSVLAPITAEADQDPQLAALAASAHLAAGRLSAATSFFEKAAAIAPDNPEILTRFAFSLISSGEPDRAIVPIESALGLQPEEFAPRVLLVLARLSAGRYTEAVSASEELRTLWPDSAVASYLSGLSHSGEGDSTKARQRFLDALSLDPAYLQALQGLGDLELRNGLHDQAAVRYSQVLEADQENPRAMIGLANVALAEGSTGEAIEWLEKARRANPRDLESRLALVALHLRKAQPEKALVLAHELERLAPNDVRVLDALGRVRLASGEPESAVASLEQLLLAAPDSVEAHYRLAFAQTLAGRESDALETLHRGAKLDPRNHPIHRLWVELELRRENPNGALQVASTFRERHPESAAAHALYAGAALSIGKMEEALDSFETAWKMEPSSDLAVRLAKVKVRAGRVEDAASFLEDWLDLQPDDSSSRRLLAEIKLRSGKAEGAMAHFEALLSKDPENWAALNNLAWLYHERSDERAEVMAKRAHAIVPDQPDVLDTLGWILVNKGKVPEGLEFLRKAKDQRPDQPEIHYHFAFALYRAGQVKEAANQLKELLTNHDTFESAPAARDLYAALTKGT